MKIDLEKHGTVSVVVPRDALTESTVPELQRALSGAGRGGGMRLVFDLRNVPFIDSAGLELLLGVAGNAAVGALRPRLAGLSDTVREALDLTDTLSRFYVFDTVESAVKSYL